MPRTNHFSRHFLPPIAVPSSRVFLQCALGNSSFQPVKSMEKGCHKCKKRGKCFAVSENCRIFASGYRNLAAEMAQLVEQRIRNAWVAGSSPAFGSLKKSAALFGLRTSFFQKGCVAFPELFDGNPRPFQFTELRDHPSRSPQYSPKQQIMDDYHAETTVYHV